MTRRRNLAAASAIALTVVAIHMTLAALLATPGWAWHYQSGMWEQRAVLEAAAMLALGAWWPVPAGLLAGAATAQVVSSAYYGSVPNYFVHEFSAGNTLAFNAPDVTLLVGAAAVIVTAAWELGRRSAGRERVSA